MAEPIDPQGTETNKQAAAPKSDESPAADPSTSVRPLGQAASKPGAPGIAPDTKPGTQPGPTPSGPKTGSDILPADTPAPVPSPTSTPEPAGKVKQPLPAESLAKTRAAAAWLATGAALIILGLIIILILQNQQTVEVNYLWFSGSLPLGAALLIAAVAGAAIVMIVGTIRLTQVRRNTRRAQKAAKAQPTRAAKKG